MKKIFGNDLRKRGGLSGKNLPITVKILNKDDENPALEKYLGFDNQWVVAYFGISPELENFVSIIMWPSHSKTSKMCYQQIYDILKEDHKALKFEGRYELRPPNGIRPQNVDKLEIEKDKTYYYNWQYFPFIKDIGYTLTKPISAVNYRKVLLRDQTNKIVEDYVTIRVTAGSILDMKGNEIQVKVPNNRSRPYVFNFKVRHNLNDEKIEKNDLFYFLLIERAGKRTPEVFSLEQINLADVIAHMISFDLYQKFVSSSTGNEYRSYINRKLNPSIDLLIQSQENNKKEDLFRICTLNELDRIFDNYKYLIFRKMFPELYDHKFSFDLWDYVKFYLSPYFDIKEKEEEVFYMPPIFHQNLNDFSCDKIQKMGKLIHSYIYMNS